MYKLSKYAPPPRPTDKEWLHHKLGSRVGMGPLLYTNLGLILKSLVHPVLDCPKSIFLHAIGQELLAKGFVVPSTENEEHFLNHIHPLRRVDFGLLGTNCLEEITSLPDEDHIAILGIPSNLGGHHPGSERGPHMLREASRSMVFRSGMPEGLFRLSDRSQPFKGIRSYDLGDIQLDRLNLDQWLVVTRALYKKLPMTSRPLTIGGDHTFTLPIVQALYEKWKGNLTLIHIDQHLDLQLWGAWNHLSVDTIHPPLHSNFMSHLNLECPKLQVFQLGLGEFQDAPQGAELSDLLSQLGRQWSARDTMDRNLDELFQSLVPGTPLYISLDVDAISGLTSTGHPHTDGITTKRILEIIKYLSSRGKIVGVDIMEFGVPTRYETETNRREAVGLLQTLLELMIILGNN